MADESFKETGGPAFPNQIPIGRAGEWYLGPEFGGGMSLRDYFAGQALTGMGTETGNDAERTSIARNAYRLADAMLVERGRR